MIHVGDTLTPFIITVKDTAGNVVDISDATALEITFEKPDETIVRNSGTFTTDGTDGKFQYFPVLTSELDMKGDWRYGGKITSPTLGVKNMDAIPFQVEETL